MNPKLGSAVSVVKISDSVLEFFKSNTREQVRIRVVDDMILDIVNHLDGTLTINQITKQYDVEKESLVHLLKFLEAKGILDNANPHEDFHDYERFRRPINFLNDYSTSHNQLVAMWENIQNSCVLIIGLGAVGTWTACNLAQSGVKMFILLDPDIVDITNLHRQFGFEESSVGKYKVDVLEMKLKQYNPEINVQKCIESLNQGTLQQFDDKKLI